MSHETSLDAISPGVHPTVGSIQLPTIRETRAPWVEELTVSNARNEYVQDLLERAAAIVWLATESAQNVLGPERAVAAVADAHPEWIAAEVAKLRATLANGGPLGGGRRDAWRWRALCILNVPRILASSSRVREGNKA